MLFFLYHKKWEFSQNPTQNQFVSLFQGNENMIYSDGVQSEPWLPAAPEPTATRKSSEPWVPALPETVVRKTPQGTPHHQRDDPNRISIKSSSSTHVLRYSPELEFNSEQCSSVASSE